MVLGRWGTAHTITPHPRELLKSLESMQQFSMIILPQKSSKLFEFLLNDTYI
jgi:hypothetical protein